MEKSASPLGENPSPEVCIMQRHAELSPLHSPSALILCDRLLTLAQDADRAGLAITAEHLLHLAHAVFDEREPTRQ
jgi:hypothetical protein